MSANPLNINPNFSRKSGLYRYSFNGQETEGDVTGTNTHTSAEFWMYDTRLGRRYDIDPVIRYYISTFACFGNSPLQFSDKNGDTWGDEEKDSAKAKDLNTKLESKQNEYEMTSEKLMKKYTRLEMKGKDESRRAGNIWKKIEEADKGAKAMKDGRFELEELAKSEQVFTFQAVNEIVANCHMNQDNVIVIEYTSDANAIHELTHAFQHLSGDVQHTPVESRDIPGTYFVDCYDEIAAYERQYFFDSGSVQGIASEGGYVMKSRDINVNWLKGVYPSNTTSDGHHQRTGENIYQNLAEYPIFKNSFIILK